LGKKTKEIKDLRLKSWINMVSLCVPESVNKRRNVHLLTLTLHFFHVSCWKTKDLFQVMHQAGCILRIHYG